MTSTMKPMLSAKFDLDKLEAQLSKLEYPLVGTPKIDGIRVICHPTLGPVTRTMKPIPNRFVWSALFPDMYNLLDGELTVGPPHNTGDGAPSVFERTTGAIMSRAGQPEFQYHVFDCIRDTEVYARRLVIAEEQVRKINRDHPSYLRWQIKFLEPVLLQNVSEVFDYEAKCLEEGYEGIMLRHPMGLYKYGRSTRREQGLIKLKRYLDDDAKIIGFEQRFHNTNEPFIDETGHQKRSSHQEGMVPLEMLGAFICSAPGFQKHFKVGVGFTHEDATRFWKTKDTLLGKWIKFRYLPEGTREKPRHPSFLGFRYD
jgi:DNA ligase-1